MRKILSFRAQSFYIAISFIILSCSKPALEEVAVVDPEAGFKHSSVELELLETLNLYRSQKGLPVLLLEEEISRQAKKHNDHMLTKKEICHHFFGARYEALIDRAGAKAASENVAFGYRTPGAVVKAWAKSKGHKKNMEGNYSLVGISVMKDGKDKFYYTSIFVRK